MPKNLDDLPVITQNPFSNNLSSPQNSNITNEIIDKKKTMISFNNHIENIIDPSLPVEKKLDSVVKMMAMNLPQQFNETLSDVPNVDRSIISNRLIASLKDIVTILVKRKEIEVSEEINPESLKFQKAFEWFVEAVHSAMVEAGADSTVINNTFNVLANKLQGWEFMISKQLKGVSSKALDSIDNPFVDNFINQLHQEKNEQ